MVLGKLKMRQDHFSICLGKNNIGRKFPCIHCPQLSNLIKDVSNPFGHNEYNHDRQSKCNVPCRLHYDDGQTYGHTDDATYVFNYRYRNFEEINISLRR